MSDIIQPNIDTPERALLDPMLCAECGRQIDRPQVADECELCGSPRCRACADAMRVTPYICPSCATDD